MIKINNLVSEDDLTLWVMSYIRDIGSRGQNELVKKSKTMESNVDKLKQFNGNLMWRSLGESAHDVPISLDSGTFCKIDTSNNGLAYIAISDENYFNNPIWFFIFFDGSKLRGYIPQCNPVNFGTGYKYGYSDYCVDDKKDAMARFKCAANLVKVKFADALREFEENTQTPFTGIDHGDIGYNIIGDMIYISGPGNKKILNKYVIKVLKDIQVNLIRVQDIKKFVEYIAASTPDDKLSEKDLADKFNKLGFRRNKLRPKEEE